MLIPERLNRDDLGRRQRRFVRLGYRPFARIARQGLAALDAHRGTEIDEPVPVFCGPCRDNDHCLMARWTAVLPLNIVS